jgi:putative ABC transport system substrate-binding protein
LHGKLIADLAFRSHLPMISANVTAAKLGGLMYYCATEANQINLWREAATYIDDKYTLVINLKIAKALGLTVPLSLIGLADEVIE